MTQNIVDTIPRPEYPRPQFRRDNNWINLNGEWEFTFDDTNCGLKERWYKDTQKNKFNQKIVVPFCFQSKLSGIQDQSFHDVVWYRKEFELTPKFDDKRIILNFGAVDYMCKVYLNGEFIGNHAGGYTGFSLDITDYKEANNILVIRVEDPSTDLEIPRGKQFWFEKPALIFYPRVTGIWQTVWVEFISLENYIKWVKITPDIDKSEVIVECDIYGVGIPELVLLANIKYDDKEIAKEVISLKHLGDICSKKDKKILKIKGARTELENPTPFKFRISVPRTSLFLWDIENPHLYDIVFKLYNSESMEVYEEVSSYFGMRKISLSEGDLNNNKRVLLNNEPIYQKLFLVQGFWPDGLYTAPSDDAIKLDIQYVKDFGFNGIRTHQKTFDPRFLYWCDKMGVLVWGEIGNAFQFSTNAQLRLINEFVAEIERDYNHPSIIAWTVLNEGWGVPGAHRDQRKGEYTVSLYHLMKSLDPTRLIIDDDGWYHTETDICTIHLYEKYESLANTFKEEKEFKVASPFTIYLQPYKYKNEPIIYSEVGGIAFDFHGDMEPKAWGYSVVNSGEDLLQKVVNVLKLFDKRKDWIHGFCYTELYDQFQEINGLLTINREPKFDPSLLKEELNKLFY